jgi:hypothetical protein
MKSGEFLKKIVRAYRAILAIFIMTIIIPFIAYFFAYHDKAGEDLTITEIPAVMIDPAGEIKDGIHVPSGFIADDGLETVLRNCTNCHSSKLVIQNRATREGWESMIRWMQRTQKLWDLGKNEEIILDYLSKNYASDKQGRRVPLSNIEWYVLQE